MCRSLSCPLTYEVYTKDIRQYVTDVFLNVKLLFWVTKHKCHNEHFSSHLPLWQHAFTVLCTQYITIYAYAICDQIYQ